ncbi:MAG: alpha/beta hydrolase, partial [Prevotella sp.]|nr:alpha/beta hydrolase [Prevotella sp.]
WKLDNNKMITSVVVYIHGKDGSATESEHYKLLFPDYEVIGLDYQTFTPWETGKEIRIAVEELKGKYENVILIANSIGAFFSMNAGIDEMIQKAYFISPIVDMEKLITNMMKWANVTEQELESKGIVHTDFGEDLSWKYLCYVKSHPIEWRVPTQILYGSNDHLTSLETITDFANKHQATLIIMKNGEHWFHTEDQMLFLDNWINAMKPFFSIMVFFCVFTCTFPNFIVSLHKLYL